MTIFNVVLLKHIEDMTLTRSVGFHRSFYFSHIVLRVGDCCVKAITEITNKTFYTRETTNSYASSEDKLSDIKIEIERWWQEYFSKGKKQMSIEREYRTALSSLSEWLKFPL
jgi:hypothetical protein